MKNKYSIASLPKRFGATLIDFALVILLTFSFSLLFFLGMGKSVGEILNPGSQAAGEAIKIDGWRMLGITFLTMFIFFCYFVLIPYFWKGFTPFRFVFNVRYVVPNKKANKFWCFLKRELIMLFPILFVNLILGITAASVKDPNALMQWAFDFSTPKEITKEMEFYYYYGMVIKSLYLFSGIIPGAIVFYMIGFKKKRGLHDIVGDGYVISTLPYEPEEPKKEKENIKFDTKNPTQMPGLYKPD